MVVAPWSDFETVAVMSVVLPWADFGRVNTNPAPGPPPASPWADFQDIELPHVVAPWSGFETVNTNVVPGASSFMYWTGSAYANLDAYVWDGTGYIQLVGIGI